MHLVSDDGYFETPGLTNRQRVEYLKGKTVYAFTKSGTPGITLRSLLTQYGIEYIEDLTAGTVPADTVNVVYLNEASDVRDRIAMRNSDAHFAVLAEPVATAITALTDGRFAVKLNFQDLWKEKNNGAMYPQAGLFFHERLLEKDKAFLDKFISLTELSVAWAHANPKAAGDLAKNVLQSAAIPGGGPVQTAVAAGRLPLWFTYAPDAKIAVGEYLNVIRNDSANSANLIG